MRIGVDFDNTIVCYDELFRTVARERGLVPRDIPASKGAVRDHLRRSGREELWTELQGCVYGARMAEARPFPGAIEFLRRCRREHIPLWIISHRTRYPYLGEQHDLHQAARRWMDLQGFGDPGGIGLAPDHVYLELTKQDKLARIAEVGCTHFIDDLPEFLAEPGFPAGVEKILFDPANQYSTCRTARVLPSWEAIGRLLLPKGEKGDSPHLCEAPFGPFRQMGTVPFFPEPPREAVAQMLAEAGLAGPFRVTALPGGANNRVYRVDCGDASLLLKAYFHHSDDPRDRLGAEFAFCRFAWDCGLRWGPRAVACHRAHNLALYEFIEGRMLRAAEIGPKEVQQAADFYRDLNGHKSDPAATALPPGSEACFSLGEHLACVQRRIERLARLDDATPLGREAAALVRDGLAPAWEKVRGQAAAEAAALGLPPDEPLEGRDRCLSPSDFGFHNAILAADGRLRFIDFEYAGWDDPAKTACDFACQPAWAVSERGAEQFARAVAAGLSDPARHLQRIGLLLPVYRVKWCAIMLNDFLPADSRRRSFARDALGEEARKRAQLEKAANALRKLY